MQELMKSIKDFEAVAIQLILVASTLSALGRLLRDEVRQWRSSHKNDTSDRNNS